MEGKRSKYSCIVRINRDEEIVQVFFESNLILFNDSSMNIQLSVSENKKEPITVSMNHNKVYNSPITWITNKTQLCKIYCKLNKIIFSNKIKFTIRRIRSTFDDTTAI